MMTALLLAMALAAASPSPVPSRATDTAGTVGTAPLRGGAEGLRRALGDRAAMPPAMAVVELTRRFYGGTELTADRDVGFSRFQAWLRECATTSACEASALPPDPVPLPGSRAFWSETGLDIAGEPDAMVLSILANRRAALLYTALVSMEPATRAWFLAGPCGSRRRSERGDPARGVRPYRALCRCRGRE